jgi:acyl carrier protein
MADEAAPSEAEVIAEIRRVLAEELALEAPAGPDAELGRDLALDSITLLTLAVALEDRFRVTLREEEAADIRTVRELAALVVRRAREQNPAGVQG